MLLRATMAYWMIRCGDLIEPLIAKMHAAQMAHDIIQMDETTVQVLKEKGRAPQSQSYMWVRRGGPPDKPVILFDYEPSRGGKVPARLLEDFQGILQTDGYEGYAAVAKRNDIVCGWLPGARAAQVRRSVESAAEERPRRARQTRLRVHSDGSTVSNARPVNVGSMPTSARPYAMKKQGPSGMSCANGSTVSVGRRLQNH